MSLLSHAWLSANHISAAHSMLKLKFPNQNGLQDTSYLRDKLQWKSNVKKFVQIIHVDGCHWACVSNKFSLKENTVQLYDSLMTVPSDDTIEQVCTILKCTDPSIKIQVMNVQLQQSPDSCGVYAIAMAHDLCNGKNPCYISYKECEMRSHLEKCFQENKITRFPCDHELRSVQCQIIHEKEVLVYCVCRYTEATTHFGNMACCDCCNKWYHEHCLQISKEVFGNSNEKDNGYICPYCL